MEITNNSVTGITAGTSQTSQSLNADFNMFLQMLTTQMQNQDPLSPMEGTDFTAQIATFSQLEQQMSTNKNLEALIGQNSYGLQNLAVSYIGKDALAEGTKVSLKDGKDVTFAHYLEQSATTAVVEIKSSAGQIVRTMEVDTEAGFHTTSWDGKDDNGTAVAAGDYTMSLRVAGTEDSSSKKTLFTYGRVVSASADAGNALLTLSDGREVLFQDIQEVREGSL